MSIIQNKITLSETNLNARALNGVHSLIECTGLEVHPSLVGLECAVQVIHAEWRSTNGTTTKNLMSKNYGRKWNNLCSIITKYVKYLEVFSHFFFFVFIHWKIWRPLRLQCFPFLPFGLSAHVPRHCISTARTIPSIYDYTNDLVSWKRTKLWQ